MQVLDNCPVLNEVAFPLKVCKLLFLDTQLLLNSQMATAARGAFAQLQQTIYETFRQSKGDLCLSDVCIRLLQNSGVAFEDHLNIALTAAHGCKGFSV